MVKVVIVKEMVKRGKKIQGTRVKAQNPNPKIQDDSRGLEFLGYWSLDIGFCLVPLSFYLLYFFPRPSPQIPTFAAPK